MNGFDLWPLLFFIFGWFFALNIRGTTNLTYRYASRFMPVIGGSVTLQIMGWIWIFVGGTLVALDFLS
ncbi:hypothetical protein ABT187_41000 [Streptomyces sp. NPDC001817]|uniref:hypothetical protein n=1 Tax=Streptomyces sp. NPDC001817 TaxID=3154398 RepID=UPI003332486A